MTVAVVVPSPATSLVLLAASHHASLHVLVNIFEIDLFRDRYTIFGDGRTTEALLKDHISSTGRV